MKALKLQVLDEADSLPVNGATVKLVVDKEEKFFPIGKNGLLQLPDLFATKEYTFEITSVGYANNHQTIKFDSSGSTKTVYLKRSFKKMDEVVITSYGTTCRRCGGCGLKVTRIYHHGLTPKKDAKFNLTVYPNPARPSQTITILPKGKMIGSYQVFAANGTVVKGGQLNAANEQPLLLNTSTWLAGTYFIRLNDRSSGKQLTEKFILQ